MLPPNILNIIISYLELKQFYTFLKSYPSIKTKYSSSQKITLTQLTELATIYPNIIITKTNLIDVCNKTIQQLLSLPFSQRTLTHITLSNYSITTLSLPPKIKSISLKPNFMNDRLSFICNSNTLTRIKLLCHNVYNEHIICPNLHTLSMSIYTENLPSLIKFPNLKRLTLSRCENLISITSIPTSLTHATIHYCTLLQDFTPLQNCKKIKQINITKCHKNIIINGLESLSHLKKLIINSYNTKELQISLPQNIRYINIPTLSPLSLSTTPKIQHLSINNTQSILQLQNPHTIKYLQIRSLPSTPLMINLQTLHIYDSTLTNLNILSSLTNLTTLYIQNCPNIHNLPHHSLNKLKKLSITITPITNLDALQNSHELHNIYLHGLPRLNSIDGLQNALKLKHITIKNCTSLNYISILNTLEELSDIYIEDCTIQNIIFTKKINPINNLKIYNCKEINKIIINTNITSCEINECTGTILCGPIEITSLTLICHDTTNFNPFHYIKKLHTLKLEFCNSLQDINDLHDKSSLKDITILYCDNNILQKSQFNPHIECLTIDIDHKNDLEEIKNMKELKSLTLCKSHKYLYNDDYDYGDDYNYNYDNDNDETIITIDAKVFKEMPKLEVIAISFLDIINVHHFKELNNLRKIYFGENCDLNDEDIECVKQLENDIFINWWIKPY